MKKITTKQRNVLDFIQKYREKNQISPSLRDIGDRFGITMGTVQTYMRDLKRAKTIKSRTGIPRSITVTPEGLEALETAVAT